MMVVFSTLLLLLLAIAMMSINKTTPPTTHTQGCSYQFCTVVVVVLELEDTVVSCAKPANAAVRKVNSKKICLVKTVVIDCFMLLVLLV